MAAVSNDIRFCHGCIVMASGQGTRFGGNKLMAKLAEKPLLGHVLHAVAGKFSQVVVVTRSEEAAAYAQAQGVQVVLHDQPYRNDAVRLGMEALAPCDSVTFFQADQPLISAETIADLLAAAESEPTFIWRACHETTVGAPVVFPAWTFPELLDLPTGKGGGFVAKKHPEQVRTVPVRDAIELFDVDTQDDLRVLQGRLA